MGCGKTGTDRWIDTGRTSLGLVAFLVSVACGQTMPSIGAGASEGGRADTQPTYSRVQKVTEALFDKPQRDAILLPSVPGEAGQDLDTRSQGVRKHVVPDVPLLPEDYVVASREAKIEKEGDWLVAHVVKAANLPDCPPLRVLPNQQLAMLQAVLAQSTAPATFLITGRVSEFRGSNYILIENIEKVLMSMPRVSVPETADPQSHPATDGGAREPTAEEILKLLLAQPTRRSVALPQLTQVIPGQEGGTATAVAESRPETPGMASNLLPERGLIVDRLGRIVPGEKWWTLVFENRGQQAAEKPIRLLPSRLLESAISLSRGGAQTAVFIVSGEVTTYEGNNYLLLRKVVLRRQAGNIR